MKNIKRTLFIVVFLLFTFPLMGQDVGIDFENLRSQDLTDEQITRLYERIQERGLSIAEIESLALARGMSPSEVTKLKTRLSRVRSSMEAEQDRAAEDSRLRTEDPDLFQRRTEEKTKADTLDLLLQTEKKDTIKVFGSDIFTNQNLTFEPSLNIPTPKNYTLGPGDEVIIDIWGAAETTYQLTVSPEGSIQIDNLGPVQLNGLTVEEASKKIIEKLSSIYSGLKGPNKNTYAQVSLGNLRSIKVSIVGQVNRPGTYTLSSLSTVFNALYAAGGPTRKGTYRAVKLLRNDRVFKEIDLYDFLVSGNLEDNVVLQDQDIIQVDSYVNRISVEGETKRTGLFETKEGETFNDLLKYAGGFNQFAYKKRVKVERNTDTEKSIVEITYPDNGNTVLKSGDNIMVGRILDRYVNRVEIQGAVFRPGEYQLEENQTLHTLIQNAEGLKGDAFLDRAIIYRTRPDYSIEAIAISLDSLMSNPSKNDVELRKDDRIKISSIFDLREMRTITINGSVINPGTFPFLENSTLKDLILQADGFKEEAAPYNIEIARRIPDDSTRSIRNEIARLINVEVENGLRLGPELEEIKLKPFDQVFVRKSPAYEEQQLVTVKGEVLYPGTYALSTRNFRLSDLIRKSGGVTDLAYIQGASLERRFERSVQELDVNLADSLTTQEQEIESLSQVGIQLQQAINNPGSAYDLLLKEGDVINIPKELETVQVRGEVLYPINVRYDDGKSFRSYISSAGGFTEQANTRRAYIVYANGEVDRTKRFLFFKSYPNVRPGSVLIIPPKEEKQKLTTAERISVMSTIVSLAAIVTNTIFQIRRN